MPRPATVPTCQKRKLSIVLRSARSRPVVQLARPALRAAPVIASFIGRRAVAAQGRDAVDRRRGDGGTDEGEREELAHPGEPEGRHPDDHREGGAGVDAEDAGVGQRVAGQALHERPRQPEGGADGEAEERAVEAGLDHGVHGMGGVPDGGERHRSRPHQQRQRAGTGQRHDRDRDAGRQGGTTPLASPRSPGDVVPRRDEGGHQPSMASTT